MKKFGVFALSFMLVLSFLTACAPKVSLSTDYEVPAGAFVIESGAGTELFLSPESETGKAITNKADFYPVFFSTNKVKNHLQLSAEKQYGTAQAYILESPHWANIPGQTIAYSEMALGITGDVMRSIGLQPGQAISKQQLVDLINTKSINLDVCNFTQCNSGELLYFTVISHLSGKAVMDTTLIDGSPESQVILDQAKALVSNINITTSTDVDARDAFLANKDGYNAIWTYEPEIAKINFSRTAQGLEPIYVVYVDGSIDAAITLFFSPFYQLTEEDKKDSRKVESYKAILDEYSSIAAAFEKDETIRKAIADSGWRPAQYNAEPSSEILKPEWGFVQSPETSTGFAPKYEISMALNDTFTQVIRKPIIAFYFLDRSGSMKTAISGTSGMSQLIEASNFIFGPEASEEFLQSIDQDITYVYAFNGECSLIGSVVGSDTQPLANSISGINPDGSTSLYRCGVTGLNDLVQYKEMCQSTHNCAIIFMTDGVDNDCSDKKRSNCFLPEEFNIAKSSLGLEFIPVYGIPFGEAKVDQMSLVSDISICTTSIPDCFKKIKGSR